MSFLVIVRGKCSFETKGMQVRAANSVTPKNQCQSKVRNNPVKMKDLMCRQNLLCHKAKVFFLY